MRLPDPRSLFTGAVVLLTVLATTGMAPERDAHSPISADEFVRALATHRSSLVDHYFAQNMNPNARAAEDRPLLLAAVMEQDWKTVGRLLKAGASVDLGDASGMKPLMAAAMHGNVDILNQFVGLATDVAATDFSGRTALHYAVAAGKAAAAELLLPLMPNFTKPCADGRDLLAIALDTGNWKIIETILQRLPPAQEWSSGARRALEAALAGGNKDQVRLLLSKHSAPPTPEGKNVPLLAYAIASNDLPLFKTLLACGADPNTLLPEKCDKDFLAVLPSQSLQNYLAYDRGVTVLMLAAGLGQLDYLQALLDAGAEKFRASKRCKMIPLYLAARTKEWRCTQVLLGSGPPPEQLRIEISLASQKATIYKDGVSVFDTICSTGRSGYNTRPGDYVITDKNRSHRSSIYRVEMPYFMRLSCLDFGMHQGVVPNYPASHGCIRLPSEAARKLFTEIPVGTLVTVK